MKIDGKRLAEPHLSSSGLAFNEARRNELTTPRLLARPEHAEKFMRAAQGESKAGPLPVPLQLASLPFPALSCQINASFPDAGQQSCKRPANEPFSTPHDAVLCFDEQLSDQRIAHQHMRNLARYFTDTWPSRLPFSQPQQFEQSEYVLTHGNGQSRRCTTYRELARFVASSAVPDMPDRLLHVAGPQLSNFLCQTYLYNPALCLFGNVGHHRIEPLANLRVTFEIACNPDGAIRVRYSASDDHVDRVMLVGPQEHDEHEAPLLAPASIRFSGTLLFAADGAYAVGPVQVRASAFQPQHAPYSL
ncbi:hypothetical protein ABC383_09665 [Noviherbaspirillum sp. 1P10PC]|uniref:hypothetical protein n=1 Tax=Noviherbaspirillum sp. 1P10PC TaxID=3132292 RepID=UPI00399FC03D